MTRHAISPVFTYGDGTRIYGPATHVELEHEDTAQATDKAVDTMVNTLAQAAGASVSTLYNDPGRFPVLVSYSSSGSYDDDGVYTVNYGLE